MRIHPLPARRQANVRPLLSLRRLPAANGQRVRTQRDYRDSGDQAAPRQACSRAGAARERSARHPPLPQVSNRTVERLRAQAQSPVRARRNARRARRPEAGRAHLYPVESEVGQAAEANAVVPGLLQHQQALAQGQSQTPQHRARKDGELTVCVENFEVNERKKIVSLPGRNLKMSESINAHHKPVTMHAAFERSACVPLAPVSAFDVCSRLIVAVSCSGSRVACDLVTRLAGCLVEP